MALPLTYAKMPSAAPIITVGMMASPSRPSVRLTALLVPTMTQYVSAMKPQTPSGYDTVLKNGTIRFALGLKSMLKPLPTHADRSRRNCVLSGADTENARYTAATSPITDCHRNLV